MPLQQEADTRATRLLACALLAAAAALVAPPTARAAWGDLHTLAVATDGGLWHDMRRGGAWTGFGDVITAATMHNVLSAPARVATAVETGRLHMIVAAVSGATFYTLRHLGGTWQQGYQLGHYAFGAQYPSTVFGMAALPGKVLIAMLGNSTDPARQLWRTNEPCTAP